MPGSSPAMTLELKLFLRNFCKKTFANCLMICTRCESEQREPRDSLRALIALNVSKTRFQGFCRFLQNEPKTSGEENFKFVICGSSVSLGLYANPLFGRGEKGRAGWVGRSRVWWGPRGSLRTGAGAERGEAASPGEGLSGLCVSFIAVMILH